MLCLYQLLVDLIWLTCTILELQLASSQSLLPFVSSSNPLTLPVPDPQKLKQEAVGLETSKGKQRYYRNRVSL